MVLILMGVTASGKTTIGQKLAQRLEWVFADGDDYHSIANREKMQDNIPLTDEDRAPWLDELHGMIEDWEENGMNGVLACSALKQQYRERLAAGIPSAGLHFIYLEAPRALIQARAEARHHAFASPGLVGTQFEALEPPTDALQVDLLNPDGVEKSVHEVVDEILARLSLHAAQDWSVEA
jgi:gluconokinase